VYIPFVNIQTQDIFLPLWVYADLLNSGSARNLEIAQKIYNQYIHEKF
jgi:hypothetical protein